MGSLSIWHWLIVLLVLVLIFGTKKLRNMGADLGSAVKGFKDGMKTDGSEAGTSGEVHERALSGIAANANVELFDLGLVP